MRSCGILSHGSSHSYRFLSNNYFSLEQYNLNISLHLWRPQINLFIFVLFICLTGMEITLMCISYNVAYLCLKIFTSICKFTLKLQYMCLFGFTFYQQECTVKLQTITYSFLLDAVIRCNFTVMQCDNIQVHSFHLNVCLLLADAKPKPPYLYVFGCVLNTHKTQ